MALKTAEVSVSGNKITAIVTGGGPPPAYTAKDATANCTPVQPPGPPIPPTTNVFTEPPPQRTFTFENLADGVYVVTINCTNRTFTQTVRVPQQNSFVMMSVVERLQEGLEGRPIPGLNEAIGRAFSAFPPA